MKLTDRIKLILLVAGATMPAAAQTPFYQFDKEKAEAVTNQVVDSLITNADERLGYRQALKEAFDELYKNSRQKPLEFYNSKIDKINSLTAAIAGRDSLLKARTDSIEMFTVVSDSAAVDPRITAKRAELEELRSRIADARNRVAVLREDSIRAAVALAEATAINDSMKIEVERLSNDVTGLKSDDDVARLSGAVAVADRLASARKLCDGQLGSVDLAALESALKDYEANKLLIADADAAKAKSAAADAAVVEQTVALAGPVQDAIRLMSGRYDKAATDAMIADLKGVAAKAKTADKKQRAEINTIVGELEDRDRAFRNANFLLSQVADECVDGVPAGYGINEKITTIVGYFSKDSVYCSHYVKFVEATDALRRGIKPGMSAKQVNELIEHLKNTL